MIEVKQNTPRNLMVFMSDTTLMFDSTVQISGVTGLALGVFASKNGGAFVQIMPTVTEVGYGWYSVSLTAAHVDTIGDLCLHITATGANPSDVRINVVANIEADTYAKVNANLDATVSSRLASTDKAGFSIAGTKTTLDQLNDISLAQIEAGTVLAKESTLQNAGHGLPALENLINAVQEDIGDPSASSTTLYGQVVAVRNATDELEPVLVSAHQAQVTITNATQNIDIDIQDKTLKPGKSGIFAETVTDVRGVAALIDKGWLRVEPV
jgi:hypothetical protein